MGGTRQGPVDTGAGGRGVQKGLRAPRVRMNSLCSPTMPHNLELARASHPKLPVPVWPLEGIRTSFCSPAAPPQPGPAPRKRWGWGGRSGKKTQAHSAHPVPAGQGDSGSLGEGVRGQAGCGRRTRGALSQQEGFQPLGQPWRALPPTPPTGSGLSRLPRVWRPPLGTSEAAPEHPKDTAHLDQGSLRQDPQLVTKSDPGIHSAAL